MSSIRVGVIGGSGYAAGELIRWLLSHPHVTVTTVMSRSQAGHRLDEVHPHLRGFTDLTFATLDHPGAAQSNEILFLALEHGKAHELVADLLPHCRVIDVSADFRLKDPAVYAKFYVPHASPQLLPTAVYGLTEWHRHDLQGAHLVAGPGCFATGALLGILPLAKEGLINGTVAIDGKTGSTGSGASPKRETHHPERATDFRAYGYFTHRHVPEIRQEVAQVTSTPLAFSFVSQSAPMVRGLFTTLHVSLTRPLDSAGLQQVYDRTYPNEPFVRVVAQPHVNTVVGTNGCEIGAVADGEGHAIIMTAIDNLGKGAASQAIQNLNVMMGWPETTGLLIPQPYPV